MSGEQLNSVQELPSRLTAMLDWVRLTTRLSPDQKSSHMAQRQFHCGKPPPAADPSTTTFMIAASFRPQMAAYQSNLDLGRDIVVDLEADADFANNRLWPAHKKPPGDILPA